MTRRMSAVVAVLLYALCATADEPWFNLIAVTAEPPVDGLRDFTVQLRPRVTHECDKVVVECIYRQEFPWQDARGKPVTKIHEPVRFVYRRQDVRFVNDLDTYISLRVPVSRPRLERMYGNRVFNKDVPVSVQRVRVAGLCTAGERWSYELDVDKHYQAEDLVRLKEPERE